MLTEKKIQIIHETINKKNHAYSSLVKIATVAACVLSGCIRTHRCAAASALTLCWGNGGACEKVGVSLWASFVFVEGPYKCRVLPRTLCLRACDGEVYAGDPLRAVVNQLALWL